MTAEEAEVDHTEAEAAVEEAKTEEAETAIEIADTNHDLTVTKEKTKAPKHSCFGAFFLLSYIPLQNILSVFRPSSLSCAKQFEP